MAKINSEWSKPGKNTFTIMELKTKVNVIKEILIIKKIFIRFSNDFLTKFLSLIKVDEYSLFTTPLIGSIPNKIKRLSGIAEIAIKISADPEIPILAEIKSVLNTSKTFTSEEYRMTLYKTLNFFKFLSI